MRFIIAAALVATASVPAIAAPAATARQVRRVPDRGSGQARALRGRERQVRQVRDAGRQAGLSGKRDVQRGGPAIARGQLRENWGETGIPLRFPEGLPNMEPLDSIRITDASVIIRASTEAAGEAELVTRRWS